MALTLWQGLTARHEQECPGKQLNEGGGQRNHRRVRRDLRAIDRGIPNRQVESQRATSIQYLGLMQSSQTPQELAPPACSIWYDADIDCAQSA